jgi:uncharacterized protein
MIPDAIDSDPSFGLLLGATAVAALVVGFLRTAIGGGIGLVLTPTLSFVLPPAVVLALLAPLMNLSDPIAVRYYWRQWDGALLRLLLPSSVLGVVAGMWLLSSLPEVWLARTIGAVALLFAVAQLALSLRRPALPGGAPPPWPAGVGAGFVMGVASMVAHSGGVVLNLYLLALRLPTITILATGNALIVFTNAVKLLGYWRVGFLTGSIVLAAVLVIPLLAVGAWLGVRVGRRLPRRAFELTLIGIAIVGAVRLLLR